MRNSVYNIFYVCKILNCQISEITYMRDFTVSKMACLYLRDFIYARFTVLENYYKIYIYIYIYIST